MIALKRSIIQQICYYLQTRICYFVFTPDNIFMQIPRSKAAPITAGATLWFHSIQIKSNLFRRIWNNDLLYIQEQVYILFLIKAKF